MKSYRLCALFIISVMAAASWSVIQAQAIPSKGINQAGKNESKSDTISPGNPTASWSITLAPAFTASYSVTIQASGPANGRNYTLKSGPTGNFSAPDNTVWTPDTASMSATYSILNTAKTAAKATMRVDVVWEPVLEGGGGGGKRPPDIPGWATGEVDLRATQVDWHFDRTVQWADGSKSVETYVFASDGNGNGVTNWNLALAPSGASPSEPGWQFSSASQGPSAWIRKSQVKSSTPSKGKVEATLTIAPGDTRKHDVTAISPEEIAFFLVEFITPAGDPVNSPKSSGDGQNEFTFSTASPGVLSINLKAKVEPSGIAGIIIGESAFEIGEIDGSTLEWATGNEDGKPTASGDNLIAAVTFTNLPASNSAFGTKAAKYHYDGEEILDQDFEVFFKASASNHPGAGPYQYGRPPNWYVYWSQTSANYGNHNWKNGSNTGEAGFVDGSWKAFVMNANKGPVGGGIWNNASGIDLFANICRHEETHRTQFIAMWGASSGIDPAQDADNDSLKDSMEPFLIAGRPYDPENPTTYVDSFNYLPPPGGPLRDSEDYCLRSQPSWINGSANSEDWGNPGMQHQTLGDPHD